MMNYNDGDDGRDNDRNRDRNNAKNAASISGSDVPIVYPITMPCYCRGVLGNDGEGATEYHVSMHWDIYLPYKNHIEDVP